MPSSVPSAAPSAGEPSAPGALVLTEEFRAALDHLAGGGHMFLTGKAGTGKSTLIRHFLATTDRLAAVVAPTGIAALNVDGWTIHRLFSFYPGISVEEIRHGGYYPGRFARTISQLQTLVIDEASMVRADLMDCIAAALERFGPAPGLPFGGVQIVLVGDLFQLPPVVPEGEKEWLASHYETPYFFAAHAWREVDIRTLELTHVFRQQGDGALVSVLNAVREGRPTRGQLAALNARTRRGFAPPGGEFWVTVTTTNRLADARNRRRLAELPGPEHTFLAEIRGDTDGFEDPTARSLHLRVGAQIMMLTNDPLDRWANGTLARVADIGEDDDGPFVRAEIPGQGVHVVRPHTWEITRPSVEGGRLVHDVVGIFTQFPFRLAWAITIHKSQGQTLDRLVVDLTGGTFADGQLYVALSRATSLDGLVLERPVLPKDLRVDARVRRFLATRALPGTVTDDDAATGVAHLAVCPVGDEGTRWWPRPVELAAILEDGTEITTLVDPGRDLGDARARYGIGAADVELAPTLADAWPALARVLAGRVPLAIDVDTLLRHLDAELKRGGTVVDLPLGLEAAQLPKIWDAYESMDAESTALGKARALRDVVAASGAELDVTERRGFAAPHEEGGYLLPRPAPGAAVVFFRGGSDADLARRLRADVVGRPLTAANRAIAGRLEELLGEPILDPAAEGAGDAGSPTVAEVLTPGARVCFTGDPVHDGRVWSRGAMEDLARRHGLAPVANVTKTKSDVLVVAEEGTRSGKARNAAKWGKPIVVAEDFFAWTRGEEPAPDAAAPAPQGDRGARGVRVEDLGARP